MTDTILTTAEVAERFRVSSRTICNWVAAGKLSAIFANRKPYRFSLEEVNAACNTKPALKETTPAERRRAKEQALKRLQPRRG